MPMQNEQTIQSCESCGMPMTRPEHFGKEEDGILCQTHCRHCYIERALIKGVSLEQLVSDINNLPEIET